MELTPETFAAIVKALGQQGADDIQWSEGIEPPVHADDFALEAIFVICNGGMKNTVARIIFDRVCAALDSGQSSSAGLNNARKAASIDDIWNRRAALFDGYRAANDKVAYCESLPHIGAITKFHLAKNFGAQVAKPDVHLQRLANREGTTAQALCERLSLASGYKVATVDVLLWRACANGVLNSRTGELSATAMALIDQRPTRR